VNELFCEFIEVFTTEKLICVLKCLLQTNIMLQVKLIHENVNQPLNNSGIGNF